MLQIINNLKEIHKLKNPSRDFTLNFVLELFEQEIPEQDKSFLINEINKIGFLYVGAVLGYLIYV